MNLLPNLVSVSELQKNYADIFKNLLADNPLFVLNNNKPQAVILSVDSYEKLAKRAYALEMKDALRATKVHKKEEAAEKLKRK